MNEKELALIPEMIKDIANKAVNGDGQEKFVNQKRLEVISKYCNTALQYVQKGK